jgi:hypothetical protein
MFTSMVMYLILEPMNCKLEPMILSFFLLSLATPIPNPKASPACWSGHNPQPTPPTQNVLRNQS